jgi:hypothetical protein
MIRWGDESARRVLLQSRNLYKYDNVNGYSGSVTACARIHKCETIRSRALNSSCNRMILVGSFALWRLEGSARLLSSGSGLRGQLT